jgi:dephospho-CoA kinase
MKMKRKTPLVIGLTGGPGVGKSEVAKIMERYGAKVIYADKIGHELLQNNAVIRRKLLRLLGDEIFLKNGQPDRQKIGRLVFANSDRLASFNGIIHPPLLKNLQREILRLRKKPGVKMVVVDAALIYEWGIADWFDFMVTVDATRWNRRHRLVKGDFTQNQLFLRIRSQMFQNDKIALADFVIKNNGRLSELKGKVSSLIKSLNAFPPIAKSRKISPAKRK